MNNGLVTPFVQKNELIKNCSLKCISNTLHRLSADEQHCIINCVRT